jgi:hypothetical protein
VDAVVGSVVVAVVGVDVTAGSGVGEGVEAIGTANFSVAGVSSALPAGSMARALNV